MRQPLNFSTENMKINILIEDKLLFYNEKKTEHLRINLLKMIRRTSPTTRTTTPSPTPTYMTRGTPSAFFSATQLFTSLIWKLVFNHVNCQGDASVSAGQRPSTTLEYQRTGIIMTDT